MKRQFGWIAAVLICATQAQATSYAIASDNFSGLTMSLGGGYAIATFNTTYDFLSTPAVTWTGASRNQVQTLLALGYGQVAQNNYYFGANLFINIGTIDGPQTAIPYLGNSYIASIQTHLQNIFGLEFQPGYALTDDDLIYMNFGGVGANIETDTSSATPSGGSSISDQFTNTEFGGLVGLGYKHNLGAPLSFFFELNYTQIAQFSVSQIDTTTNRDETFRQSPYVAEALLGITFILS